LLVKGVEGIGMTRGCTFIRQPSDNLGKNGSPTYIGRRSADKAKAAEGAVVRHRALLDADKVIVFSFVFSADE
jgi:hypothetical protein